MIAPWRRVLTVRPIPYPVIVQGPAVAMGLLPVSVQPPMLGLAGLFQPARVLSVAAVYVPPRLF